MVISFCLVPVLLSALKYGGFVPREWLAVKGPGRVLNFVPEWSPYSMYTTLFFLAPG